MDIIQQQKEWEVGKDFEIKKIIGTGSYGKVCEAFHLPSGQKVAIKKILNLFEDAVDTKRMLREIQILQQLDSPHIVKLYDILEPTDIRNFKHLYLVLEYAQSDLKKLLKSNQFLTELHVKTILYNLLLGLKHMHSARILHRDIKPANILINEDCTLKYCDFGLARSIAGMEGSSKVLREEYLRNHDTSKVADQDVEMAQEQQDQVEPKIQQKVELSQEFEQLMYRPNEDEGKRQKLCGMLTKTKDLRRTMKRELTGHVVTRWYRAPELILLEKDYGEPIDIWAIGCIFSELLSMMKENVPNCLERKALFPGGSCFPLSPDANATVKRNGFPVSVNDQLNMIFDVIGTPTEEEASFVTDQKAIDYLKSFPAKEKTDLSKNYPGVGIDAMDLLNKLLTFNPFFRPSIDQCLEHPYLSNVRIQQSETALPQQVKLDLEFQDITLYKLKDLFQREVEQYRTLRSKGATFLQTHKTQQQDQL